MAQTSIDLIGLEPQSISRNLRGKYFLLYSNPKAGKTTLASKFEKVLIAGFEAGTNGLNNVFVQPIKTWNDWKTCVKQLCTKKELKEKFYTIAIDTVDQAWQLVDKYICNIEGVENLSDVGYGKLYKKKIDEFMGTFRDLSYEGYGIIFTSHATEKTYINNKGEEYVKSIPSLPASGSNNPFDAINKFVDVIAYIKTEKESTDEPKRYLCFRSTDNYLAGSRLAYMPDKVELSYENLVNAVYEAIDKEVENSGGKVTEDMNPYSVKTFSEAMDEARALWNKAIAKEKTDDVMEILREKFGKPIKFSDIQENELEELNEVIDKINGIL